MKTLKRIMAVVLAVIMTLCIGSISVSAATAPTFELKLVSQDKSSAIFDLCLKSGEFNALDATFKNSSNITIKSIITTDEFDAYMLSLKKQGAQFGESANAQNKKLSFASTVAVSKPISVYRITVTKAKAADIVATDLTIQITECVLGDNSVLSAVRVTYSLGKLEIDHELSLNYKKSGKINIDTTFKPESITWSSSNTKVATVDENGNVYAAGRGTAVITAETANGAIADTCNVTVSYAWWQWIIIIVLFGFIWY